jgi:DNA polymerase-3 subunit alpha
MLKERTENGEFKSLDDFARRVESKAVNKKTLESLIRAGAFDWVGEHRAALFSRIESVLAAGASAQKDKQSGQFSLFGDAFDEVAAPPPLSGGQSVTPWTQEEMLAAEKELLGFYISGHPLDPYRAVLEGGGYKKVGEIEELSERERKKAKFGVFVADVTVKYTKTGKQFAIMRVEDFTGSREMMVWGEEYEKFGKTITKGSVVEVTAKVEQDTRNDNLQLVAQAMKPLEVQVSAASGNGNGNGSRPVRAEVRPLVLRLDSERDSVEDLQTIRNIVNAHPGATPVHFSVRCGEKRVHLVTAVFVSPEDGVMEELKPWIG